MSRVIWDGQAKHQRFADIQACRQVQVGQHDFAIDHLTVAAVLDCRQV